MKVLAKMFIVHGVLLVLGVIYGISVDPAEDSLFSIIWEIGVITWSIEVTLGIGAMFFYMINDITK